MRGRPSWDSGIDEAYQRLLGDIHDKIIHKTNLWRGRRTNQSTILRRQAVSINQLLRFTDNEISRDIVYISTTFI